MSPGFTVATTSDVGGVVAGMSPVTGELDVDLVDRQPVI